MLTKEQNERLTRVGPGQPMGELMRRYWHPVAAACEFTGKFPLKKRLLGEDLIVYRSPSGDYGAMQPFCPHRGASLEFASIERDGVRCAYHGWKFSAGGACLDQPAEPGGGAKSGTRVRAYPAQEMGGLVWLYLGPDPAPLLPRYDVFVWDNCLREIGQVRLPCNFVQIMENSVDPHHVEWLHGAFASYARGDQATALYGQRVSKIGFDTFEYGIIKRRLVEGQTEESDSWKIGHPLVFPNILRVGGGGNNQAQIRVPVDDVTTHIFYCSTYVPPDGVKAPPQKTVPLYDIPLKSPDGSYALGIADVQDLVMWSSQGPIVDRTNERLGRSDVGVGHLRRMYFSEMEKVERGEDPIAVIRDAAKNRLIELPQEHHTLGSGDAYLRTILTTGQSRFSPLLPTVLAMYELDLEPA
jgi:5,5'-dehydrodivanillate O-demethylase oxygenase subunit